MALAHGIRHCNLRDLSDVQQYSAFLTCFVRIDICSSPSSIAFSKIANIARTTSVQVSIHITIFQSSIWQPMQCTHLKARIRLAPSCHSLCHRWAQPSGNRPGWHSATSQSLRRAQRSRIEAEGSSPLQNRSQTKASIISILDSLGYLPAILPGDQPERAQLDALVATLEQQPAADKAVFCTGAGGIHSKSAERYGDDDASSGSESSDTSRLGSERGTSSSSSAGSDKDGVNPELLGAWNLMYANNGTVVTRTRPAQFLSSISQVPGFGLSEITQELALSPSGTLLSWPDVTHSLDLSRQFRPTAILHDSNGTIFPSVCCSSDCVQRQIMFPVGSNCKFFMCSGDLESRNWALLGLGPFGTWKISIEGDWLPTSDPMTVDVRTLRKQSVALPYPLHFPLLFACNARMGWISLSADAHLAIARALPVQTLC